MDVLDEAERAEREGILREIEIFSSLKKQNRKFNEPSRLMHPSDGNRYRCPWIEDSITIHSDGNVSCGVDDPHGQRSFGNIRDQIIAEIYAKPEYENLRRKLWNGYRCTDCGLFKRVKRDWRKDLPARPTLPSTMVVEPTIVCNIRLHQRSRRAWQ